MGTKPETLSSSLQPMASSRSPPYYKENHFSFGSSAASGVDQGRYLDAKHILKKVNRDEVGHRKRSSSIVHVEKIEQSHEELLDQSAGFNYNADWVNYKGMTR